MSEETLQSFQCGALTEKHFLINPVKLHNCKHFVCRDCMKNEKETSIRCTICGAISVVDRENIKVSFNAKQAVKLCFSKIFEIIEKETSSKLEEFKSRIIYFK